jgi:hypothetical protein
VEISLSFSSLVAFSDFIGIVRLGDKVPVYYQGENGKEICGYRFSLEVVEALKSDRENVEVDLVVESLRSSDGSPLDEAGKRRFRCEMSERWFVRADPIAIETLEGEGGSRWLRLRRPVTIDIAKIEENDRRYSKSFEGLRVRWEAAAALIRRTLR